MRALRSGSPLASIAWVLLSLQRAASGDEDFHFQPEAEYGNHMGGRIAAEKAAAEILVKPAEAAVHSNEEEIKAEEAEEEDFDFDFEFEDEGAVVQAANNEPAEQKDATRKSTQQLPQSEQNRQKLSQQKFLKEFPHLYGYGRHADVTPPDNWRLVRGVDDTPERTQTQSAGVRRVRVEGRAEELRLIPLVLPAAGEEDSGASPSLEAAPGLTPQIYFIEDFLTGAEAGFLLAQATKYLARANTSDAMDSRRSRSTTLAAHEGMEDDPTVRAIEGRAGAVAGVGPTHVEPLQIVQYRQHDFYAAHHDAWAPELVPLASPRRWGHWRAALYIFFVSLYRNMQGRVGMTVPPGLGPADGREPASHALRLSVRGPPGAFKRPSRSLLYIGSL